MDYQLHSQVLESQLGIAVSALKGQAMIGDHALDLLRNGDVDAASHALETQLALTNRILVDLQRYLDTMSD